MEEMMMLKRLGEALQTPDTSETRARVRSMLVAEIAAAPPQPERRRGHMKMLLIAALFALALGGIAIADGFSDGAGVDAPPAQKIPYVHDRIDQIKRQLAALDTSTVEGEAKAASLQAELTRVREVLAQLCADAGEPTDC